MKRPLCLLALLLTLSTPVLSESIKRAVIYQDMAYLTLDREAVNHKVLLDVPPDVIPESITAVPKGGVIRSLEVELWRSVSGKTKQIQDLLAQKRALLASKKKLQATVEKEIVIIFDAAGATKKESTFPKTRMVEALAFIDERVNALNARHIKLGQEMDELETQVKDLEDQLRAISERQGYRITVEADGIIQISYALKNAYWKPEYAVYAAPGKGELRLETSARIWQATGMDWDAEEVFISTGRPSFGIQAPELYPWRLAAPRIQKRMYKEQDMLAAAPEEGAMENEMEVKATATSYFIGAVRTVTIPGDGTPRTVSLQKKALDAKLFRITAPKLKAAAFLRAEGTWPGNAPLIPGSYSAFVDNEFCGKGNLKEVQPGEKMTLDLGKDEGIKVERKEKVYHEKTITGKDKTTYTYTITIENTRAEQVRMTAKDQIPISQDEEIKVNLLEANPKAIPDEDGMLTWEIDCPAHKKTTVGFSFSVTGLPPF